MGKEKLTDEALFKLIRKFIEDNPSIHVKECDDVVAKLIGKDSPNPSSN
jgi:hypothetical protein